MEVLLALTAALCFALGTVLQQRVAAAEPDEEALKAGFLLRLARRPLWLAGIAVDGLGFLAQAAALGVGRLVVVQPLLATSVVFALPIGARLDGRPVSGREYAGAIAVVAGLAVFLVLSDPSGGRDDAPLHAWLIAGAVTAAVCGTLVVAGAAAGRAAPLKAALLGTAAGILFGVSAALTKATVDLLGDGVVDVLLDWHLYALLLVGLISMTLSQASLQTGALAPAVATQMSLDPVTSLVLGTTLLDETIHDDPLGVLASVAGLIVMLGGLALLAGREGAAAPQPASAR